MSFRLFIYYCAMCGGAAAFVGWAVGRAAAPKSDIGEAAFRGMWLGLFVAYGLALVDALWNLSITQFKGVGGRVVVAVAVGSLGGFVGGAIGQMLFGLTQLSALLIFGWTITGLLIGASVGIFDLLSRYTRDEDTSGAKRKIFRGILGGALGGLVGGVLYLLLQNAWSGILHDTLAYKLWSPSATGFVVLGLCIGLLIGLAQVILKEAWLRVEVGFRAGRDIILTKEETTIGRAESCDIGLFGDAVVEPLHARILLEGNRYFLADNDTAGGTYVNGELIREPVPLHSGDSIEVGHCILRFREKHKRADD